MKKSDTIKNYLILFAVTALAVVIYLACYGNDIEQLISIDMNKPMDGFIEVLILNNGIFIGNVLPECDYNIQNIIMLLLGKLCGNIWTGINVYYILSFFMITFSMYWCVRKLEVSIPVSIALSVLTAFLPYHTDRGQGQLITANFFIVPLFVGLLYEIYYKGESNRKKNAYICLMCFAPLIDVRATFMMLILMLVLMFHRFDKDIAKISLWYLLPGILFSVIIGMLSGIFGRTGMEQHLQVAKEEGLRILDMLMPVRYHIVSKLNNLRLDYDIGFSVSGESGLNTMGLLVNVGFVCSMCALFFSEKCDKRIKWFSWINIIVIFISNIYGFNLFIEYCGLHLGYWNRMGIFVLISAVIVTGILADSVKKFVSEKIPTKICKVMIYIVFAGIWLGAYLELLLRSNM